MSTLALTTAPPVPATSARTTPDRLVGGLLLALLLSATVFQKLALPLGHYQLLLPLLVMLGATLVGVISGRLELRTGRSALLLLMLGGMTLSQLLGGQNFSFPSVLVLIAVHAPYAFGLRPGLARPGLELEFARKIGLFVAILGVAQYFLQFVVGSDYAFFLDSGVFPSRFIAAEMNNMNALSYASTTYKSNGLFFIEPSLFCQYLAVMIIIEMVYFQSVRHILVYLAGIAVTFSGTGLIILFVLVPFYLLQQRRIFLLSALFLSLLSAPVWAPVLGLGTTVERVGEFDSKNSSAYARFLSIIPQIDHYVLPEMRTTLFGLGAGSMRRTGGGVTDYTKATSTWGKIMFEYGLLGVLVYLPFTIAVFFFTPASIYLRLALLIQYYLLGEYMLPAFVHPTIIALLAWPAAGLPSGTRWTPRSAGDAA